MPGIRPGRSRRSSESKRPAAARIKAIEKIPGGVTAARGFLAAGVSAGIKKGDARDLALVLADSPCTAAGVFTANRVKAHPVVDAMAKLGRGRPVGGILVNSGSANACTGPQGMKDLEEIISALAAAAGLPKQGILMASTGVIGERLPVDKILAALPTLVSAASRRGHAAAARAIMTTDTRPKEYAVTARTRGGTFTVGGMAKGAGMINPHLATMLAFITTDAAAGESRALRALLRESVEKSFNKVDLDGDTSTNDSVIILAGGLSGVDVLRGHRKIFAEALDEVCFSLAGMIAADMEGAAKRVSVMVAGAASDREAEAAARIVAESPLVKTALHGRDPNWGRVMAALGRSGASFNPEKVYISINGCPLVRKGIRNPLVSEGEARKAMAPRELSLRIDLKAGRASCTIRTGDLTADYIRINAHYRS